MCQLHHCYITKNATSLRIDHLRGQIFLNGSAFNVTFPRSLVQFCASGVGGKKSRSYFFQGNKNKKRGWVRAYAEHRDADVTFTRTGRNTLKMTGAYDMDYYSRMRSAKFALAPPGDFLWSYRFFEPASGVVTPTGPVTFSVVVNVGGKASSPSMSSWSDASAWAAGWRLS